MKSFGTSKEFLMTDDIEWETVGEGVKRKIMGYDDKIMLVHVRKRKYRTNASTSSFSGNLCGIWVF
jgi:hypothetical protein